MCRMTAISTLFLIALSGCGFAPPKIISGDDDSVAIETAGMERGNPGITANRHCASHGKKAVLLRVQDFENSNMKVWYFSCK